MRMDVRSIAAATTLAILSISSAQASLQNPSADALQALADLTRPQGEKQFPAGYVPKAATYNEELSNSNGGVAWSVNPKGASGAQSKSAPFSIIPTSQQMAKSGGSQRSSNGNSEMIRPSSANSAEDGGVRMAAQAQSNGTSKFWPINPPSFPLAVRGPYLSAWLPSGSDRDVTPPNKQGNGGYLAGQYPSFWTSSYGADGEFRLGWSGFIRIDGKSYQWMGDSFGTLVAEGPNASQLSAEYTATRTLFAFDADGVRFNVTFLSPITPNDYLRQSLPLSYLHFELDKDTVKGKKVQIYTEIDERWVTGHDYDYQTYPYSMNFEVVNSTSLYTIQRDKPEVYTEFRQRAEWGSAVYAVKNVAGLTSRNFNNIVTQKEFLDNGNLTFDHTRVAGPDNSFAFAVDFSVPNAASDVVLAVGHLRDPYLNYVRAVPGADGKSYQEDRFGYWRASFPNFNEAVAFFINDFDDALSNAKKFDAQLAADSSKAVGGGAVGEHYAAMTQLAVRQAFGALEITISKDSSGALNSSDVMVFMKEISSSGVINTVDVIFPLSPLLGYTSVRMLRDLLRPVFVYAKSIYPNKWAPHDLGVYPNAKGYPDGKDEPMQVEESGNMILMSLLYAQLAGAKEATPWLQSHYSILTQWAGFLSSDSLVPAEQLSTDDFAGTLANQTNLAAKGIIALGAMSKIADLCGHKEDAATYHNISVTYIKAWANYAVSQDGSHLKLAYQNDSSWSTAYNLFFDRLLNLQLVPQSIYALQDKWYPQKMQKYGLPLDSRHTWAKSDWAMFAAAASASDDTKAKLIEGVYSFASNGKIDSPFADLYSTVTGDTPKEPQEPLVRFLARPVQGALLSFLVRDKADQANGVATYQYAAEFPYNSQKQTQKQNEKQKQKRAIHFG